MNDARDRVLWLAVWGVEDVEWFRDVVSAWPWVSVGTCVGFREGSIAIGFEIE